MRSAMKKHSAVLDANYFTFMESGMDRRQYPRVSLNHVTVEVYSELGQLTSPEFCFIINVSENGMLFKADAQKSGYGASMHLRLTFVLPDNNIVIRTDATAIHVRATELSQYVGVQFKNLSLAEIKLIREFVVKSAETAG
jgi:PilZ domain